MNLLFLDTETTGTDPKKHAVIEIAAQLHKDGTKVAEVNEQFFDKRSPVSLQALKYNNTRVEGLYAKKDESIGFMTFVDWVLSLKMDSLPIIVGHNVSFDVKFLHALFDKYGIDQVTEVLGYKTLDTCVIAQYLIMAGKLTTEGNKTTLAAIAKALNIDVTKYTLHCAKDDVALTAEVFYGLINLLKS